MTKHWNFSGYPLPSLLALLVCYGFAALPFNMAPLLISTIIHDLGISETSAGLLISAELITIALVTIALSPQVERLPLRSVTIVAALSVAALNLLCLFAKSFNDVFICRLAAAMAEGTLITAVYYLIGVSRSPVRLFGLATVANIFMAALYLGVLPLAISTWGYQGAFAMMAAPIAIALPLLLKLQQPISESSTAEHLHTHNKHKTHFGWVGLVFIAAVFMVQVTQGGYYAYVEQVGRQINIDPATIGLALSAAYLLSLLGSGVASILGDRIGIFIPMAIGMSLHALAVCAVVYASDQSGYILATQIQALGYFLFLPYMLGLAATLDHSGRLSTLIGGIIMLGLGIGPFSTGVMVEHLGYTAIALSVVISTVFGYILLLYATTKMKSSNRLMSSDACQPSC